MTEGNSKEFEMAVGTSAVLESGMMEGDNFYTPMESTNETEAASQSNWSAGKPPDTGQLCRSCANTSDYLIPIFEGEGLEHQLEFKIQKHLPIQVSSTDTLPLQLCYQCASTLIAWDTMISSCLEAEKKLKAIQEAAEECKNRELFEDSHMEGDTELVDSDDEPLITSKTKLLSEKNKATPIKKKILSKAKSRTVTIKNEKTATNSKEDEDKERSNTSQGTRNRSPSGNLNRLRGNCAYCPSRCGKAFDLASHLSRDHSLNVYHCQYCDKIQEGQKRKFVRHVQKHLAREEGGHGCYACGEKFRTGKSLSEHFAEVHGNECDVCGERFENGSQFRKHAADVHNASQRGGRRKPRGKKENGRERAEGKYFTCHLCGKQFSHSTGLSYHLKHVHEGIKEHECDICGRRFALKAAREDHRRIHTGERPFVCHTCGKTFKAKASLYIHGKTHTDSFPFPCSYCSRRFRWRQQLLSHITTHTGEKKHFCEVCGKGFGVKNDLTRHKLVHSQEKPFLCLICGMSFGQKRYLKNHEKTKHKKEDRVEVSG